MAIPAERLEADGIRHLERLTALKAHYAAKGLPSGVTNTPLPHIGERDSSRMTTEAQRRKANAGQPSNPPATIKIVLEAINRRGRSSASLPDGTSYRQILVTARRRQLFCAASSSLKTIASAVLLDRQPFDRIVRWRTVAKVLSMGLVVRKCFQCSAGKS